MKANICEVEKDSKVLLGHDKMISSEKAIKEDIERERNSHAWIESNLESILLFIKMDVKWDENTYTFTHIPVRHISVLDDSVQYFEVNDSIFGIPKEREKRKKFIFSVGSILKALINWSKLQCGHSIARIVNTEL